MLASNSHRAKWKVINPSGNEAMVPSVCFTVPPPNKEAVDMATRWDAQPLRVTLRTDGCCRTGDLSVIGINDLCPCRTEQLYQNVLALWHRSHINMKSVASWHYLMADIQAIRNWNVASVCLTLSGPITPSDDHCWSSNLACLISSLILPTSADKDDVARWTSAGLEQPAVPLRWVPWRQRGVGAVYRGRLCPARERCCGL